MGLTRLNLSNYMGLEAGSLAFPGNLTEEHQTTPLPNSGEGIELDLPYTISEVLVAIIAVIGNALTITVFAVDRKLRRLTNYYIVSLALADLLVGVLGIPFAILAAIGLPRSRWACLLGLSTLLMLCTISIFCLVAVSVDRYWAILHPLRYNRVMTSKIAKRIILACWAAGTLVGLLPVMGWHQNDPEYCFFTRVMNYNYLVFIYFCTIVGPGLLMAFFYAHIYTVVLKQLRQIAAHEPQGDTASVGTQSSQRQRSSFFRSHSRGQMSESSSTKYDQRRCSTNTNSGQQVPNPRSREVKAAKSLSIIVLFFMVSWFPLYTINCVQAFCTDCQVEPNLMFFTIILSHLNSAINPFLYAYHMKDFRNALKMFILHRLLRRPMDLDYMYGRSLVSQHHHSIYRANMTLPTHSSSPHMANTQTTPLMSSPSPLPDTPLDELRSQSSTVSSYDPLSSRHNMSPSSSIPPAIMTSSEDVQYPSSRPRAATITTHTSPASSRTRLVSTGNHSQPLCSDNFPQTLNPKDVTAWRASTLSPLSTSCTLGPTVSHHHTNTRPNHDMTICIADINFTSRDASATSTHSFHSASCDGGQSIITDTMTPEVITEASLQTSNTKCCPDSPSTTKVEQKETVIFAQPVSGESDVIATRSSTYSSHTCSSVLTNSDTNSEGLIKQVLLSSSCKEHLNMSTLNKTSSNETLYSNPLLDDISISNQSNLTKCKEERHGDESKILLTEQQDKKIPVREFIEPDSNEETLRLINHTSPVIPNGNVCNFPAMPVDDKCKPLHDEEPSSCNAPTLPCLEPTTEENKLGNCQEKADDRTSEQSCVSKEFGKYLPQILRRREGGLRSKCSKKKRNWWTELMRQKSYHGISFELKSSKHMKRAQSISGALDS